MNYFTLYFGGILSIALFYLGCTTTTKTTSILEEPTIEITQIKDSVSSEVPVVAVGQERQRGPGGNQGDNEAFQLMVESLHLSADQHTQFNIINSYYREKMTKLREEARASGEGFQSMREVFQKLREEQNTALQNLLTEDQFSIYSAFLQKQRAERGNRQG